MARIFISYRREDSEIWAARLEDSLKRAFPSGQVFRDVTSIAPGVDFVVALDTALRETAAAIVVIGPKWLSATDRNGNRRIDQPTDFVRLEVAESLARADVRIFPVLVQGAEMPVEADLPEPLKPLWRRNALELTVKHWDHDVAQLVQRLEELPGLAKGTSAGVGAHETGSPANRSDLPAPPLAPPRKGRLPRAAIAIVLAALGVVILAGLWLVLRPIEQPERLVSPKQVPEPKVASAPSAGQETRPQAGTRAARPPEQPARVVVLRGQDTFTRTLGFSDNLVELAKTVETLSAGRVTFEVLPSGAVVPASGTLEAVAKGTLHFAWVEPGAFSARNAAFALLDSPPFGPEPADYLRWRRDPHVKSIVDELYSRNGVRALSCGVIWPADLWTNRQIRTASDLKGRKIRLSGGLRSEIYKGAGASIVSLPGGEMYMALQAGAIDSIQLLDPATGVRLGLHEVARALYFPARLSPAAGIDLLIHPATWDALDASARSVLEKACERNAGQMLASGRDAQKVAVSKTALRGVTVEEFPKDVQDLLLKAWGKVATEKNSDPTFKRLFATLAKYRRH